MLGTSRPAMRWCGRVSLVAADTDFLESQSRHCPEGRPPTKIDGHAERPTCTIAPERAPRGVLIAKTKSRARCRRRPQRAQGTGTPAEGQRLQCRVVRFSRGV